MKVKELIRDTIWNPSSEWETQQPTISVLLPTFCRAQSGLFCKVVDSILAQSFLDYELIIIDDGSIDGTRELIAQYMQQDSRISWLSHPKNVGLPVVSLYEGLLKSRGKYFIFSFDDFVFETNAFELLYEAIESLQADMCHGIANVYFHNSAGEQEYTPLGNDPIEVLPITNTLANSSVIIKRSLFDKIGFYDPHILLTRICDWDLWLRISLHYPIHKINAVIGSEYGNLTKESLGNSYFHAFQHAKNYMSFNKNHLLLPSNLGEYDITHTFDWMTSYDKFYIQEALKFYHAKSWYQPREITIPLSTQSFKKIIYYGNSLVNYFLHFAGLNSLNTYYQFEIIAPHNIHTDIYQLIDADLVIINRTLHQEIVSFLKKLHIPCYYLIDDNFFVLHKENRKDPYLKDYTLEKMRPVLSLIDGVFCGSIPLKNYFIENNLHPHVMSIMPVIDNALVVEKKPQAISSQGKITVAIVANKFRKKSIIEHIIPALIQLNKTTPVTLYIRKGLLDTQDFNQIPFACHEIDTTELYHQYILHLREKSIDVVIHPAGITQNSEYKTHTILLTAFYLNTPIIVTEEPAFEGLGEAHGVIKVQNTTQSILNALQILMHPNKTEEISHNLHLYCMEQFSAKKTQTLLESLTKDISSTPFLSHEKNKMHFMQLVAIELETYQKRAALLSPLFKLRDYCYHLLRSSSYKEKLISLRAFFRKYCTRLNFSHPDFYNLITHSEKRIAQSEEYYLTLSPSIHQRKFMEYCVENIPLPFSKVTIAISLASQRFSPRAIGMEILSSKGEVIRKALYNLSTQNLQYPICFHFPPVSSHHSKLIFRFFSQGVITPLFIFEYRKKGIFPRRQRELLCEIN